MTINHRGTCTAEGCGRIWRENCEDCLEEVTARHTAETGHQVHLDISDPDAPSWGLRGLTRLAGLRRPVLLSPKRGW